MLAELMLPDQAHVRKQDWTIFFLHKDTGEEDEKEDECKNESNSSQQARAEACDNARAAQGDVGSSDTEVVVRKDQEEVEGGEGPPLIYVLNLVNTKQDTTAKRFNSPGSACFT